LVVTLLLTLQGLLQLLVSTAVSQLLLVIAAAAAVGAAVRLYGLVAVTGVNTISTRLGLAARLWPVPVLAVVTHRPPDVLAVVIFMAAGWLPLCCIRFLITAVVAVGVLVWISHANAFVKAAPFANANVLVAMAVGAL
jgi:hypothetical protein